MITESQSFAYDIRDTFYNVLTADAFFSGYTFRKTKFLQLQPDLIPYLCVYLVDETQTPDGDANAGCIRFNHTARIGFSVLVQNNDGTAAERLSDQAYLRIKTLLYTDQTVMNVLTDKNVEGVNIESISRATRRHIYGSAGLNNETPIVELQYEVHVFFRTEWYPDITDMLEEIDVTVKPNNDPNADTFNIKYLFDTLRAHLKSPSTKGNDHG